VVNKAQGTVFDEAATSNLQRQLSGTVQSEGIGHEPLESRISSDLTKVGPVDAVEQFGSEQQARG
jgi:hypothetical protein